METFFSKMYPKGSYAPEEFLDKVVEVYEAFFESRTRLEYILKKLVGTVEWKKVMCFTPDNTGKKVLVWVANTSEYYYTGVSFKDGVSKKYALDICNEINDVVFWVDFRMCLRIRCSVIDNRPKSEKLQERHPGEYADLCKKLGEDNVKTFFDDG